MFRYVTLHYITLWHNNDDDEVTVMDNIMKEITKVKFVKAIEDSHSHRF